MNNNQHPKRKRQASIDGFFVGGNNPTQAQKPSLNSFNKYHRPNTTGSTPGTLRSVDAFSKSLDGFKSNGQSVISPSRKNHQSADIGLSFSGHSSHKKESKPHQGFSSHSSYNSKSVPETKLKKSRFGLFNRKNKKHRSKKQKFALRTSAVLGSMLLIVGGGLAMRAFLLSRNIFKGGGSSALLNNQNVDPSLLKGEGDGRINILVLGKGGPEQRDGPDLTDTIIIASIDPIANEATLLSIPRDFWVKSPAGSQSKINQVYYDAKYKALNSYSSSQKSSDEAKVKSETAGVDALKQVITDSMGVPIHYYAMIDFAGFKKAIDTVGGIDINVNEGMAVTETMWINGRYLLDVKAGQEHFDGNRALAFSRSRKTSGKGDFARSERQRAVMIALKDKALSTGTLANPVKLNQLIGDFEGQLGTDFSVNEMLRLYDLSKVIQSDKIVSIGLDEQVVGDTINALSVQVPKAGLFNYDEIRNYVRNAMRDSFLKKEDAKIAILNGTSTAGLATKKSTELKSYGYNVISVGDAPNKDFQNTIVVDLKNGQNKYTKNYLEKRLGLTSVGTLPDSSISTGDADFVIILGSNETSSSQN